MYSLNHESPTIFFKFLYPLSKLWVTVEVRSFGGTYRETEEYLVEKMRDGPHMASLLVQMMAWNIQKKEMILVMAWNFISYVGSDDGMRPHHGATVETSPPPPPPPPPQRPR
jgi:hypothetical protein